MTRDFWKSGHTPTLLSAFLYFDIAFMVWVMLGPLGVQIAATLGLTAAQKGMMVATPVLAGAVLRVLMGVLVDHLKPKKAGLIGQLVVMTALAWAWLFGIHSYREVLVLGRGARLCRCSLCRGAAAGVTLVSAAASGHRAGHCRGGQFRHRDCGPVCTGTGGGLWLGQCVRPGA